VLVQLTHEAIAEAADLAVRLALGVEVRAALATTHVEAGQGVFENLLEAQELEHAEVDRRVQSEAALVGTQGRVELHAEGIVDLDFALVVLPDYAELDDALGDGNDFEGIAVLWVLLEERAVLEGRGQFWTGGLACGRGLQWFQWMLTVVGLLELGLVRKVRHCEEVPFW
jgi:hypothetical protein